MITEFAVVEQLRVLHEGYAEQVNLAIAEGREDIIDELVAAYPDEALRLMVAADART